MIALSLVLAAPVFCAQGEGEFRFGVEPEIKNVRPRKPPKIKLKRDEDGKYSWEITGGDVEAVKEADSKLREYLKIE